MTKIVNRILRAPFSEQLLVLPPAHARFREGIVGYDRYWHEVGRETLSSEAEDTG